MTWSWLGHAHCSVFVIRGSATLRGLVQAGTWSERVYVPLDHVLERGRLLHAKVSAIREGEVEVVTESGETERLPCDFAVVATGSTYKTIVGKIPSLTAGEGIAEMTRISEVIASANRIAIIGGGPVGVELAGELREQYPEEKDITIIHSGGRLLSSKDNGEGDKIAEFAAKLQEKLDQRNIQVRLNQRASIDTAGAQDSEEGGGDGKKDGVETIAPGVQVGSRTLEITGGDDLECDLVLVTAGAQPNTEAIRAGMPDTVGENGRVRVNSHMQVVRESGDVVRGVYAAGDCCDAPGAKTAYQGGEQVPVLVDCITKEAIARAEGRALDASSLPEFTPFEGPAMVVPIGSTGGQSLFPNGMMPGGWVTGKLKGKDLLAPKFWGEANASKQYPQPRVTSS